jgi:iron complex outermembrane receptor protein
LTVEYEGFLTFATFAYLFTEYTDFVTFEDRFLPNPVGGEQVPLTLTEINNFSGNRVVAAPEWNFSGYTQYEIDLGRFGALTPRLDYTWRSRIFFTPNNDSSLGDDSRWLLHARLGWTDSSDRFDLSFWVRNLTDEAYRVESLDFTPPQSLQQINYAFSVPRTIGMTFGVRF